MVRSSFSLNNGIFRVTTVMLLAPVCEELVFRGISLSSSRRAFTCRHSDAIAILLSALLFALYHGQFSPVLLRPSHGNPSRAARHMDVFPAAIDPSSHNDQRIFLISPGCCHLHCHIQAVYLQLVSRQPQASSPYICCCAEVANHTKYLDM